MQRSTSTKQDYSAGGSMSMSSRENSRSSLIYNPSSDNLRSRSRLPTTSSLLEYEERSRKKPVLRHAPASMDNIKVRARPPLEHAPASVQVDGTWRFKAAAKLSMTVSRWKSALLLKDSAGGSDDVKKNNERLQDELDDLNQEYKKLKGNMEKLHNDYDASKEYDYFRRYTLLKSMIKRTMVQLQLTDNDNVMPDLSAGAVGMLLGTRQFGVVRKKEEKKKREESYKTMTKEEISSNNDALEKDITSARRRNQLIRDQIRQMGVQYDESKRFAAFQRYRLMKTMIKSVTNSKAWL